MSAIDRWSEQEDYSSSTCPDYPGGQEGVEYLGTCDFCWDEDVEVVKVNDLYFYVEAQKQQQWICNDCIVDAINKQWAERYEL
jgi:uncharacterized protein (DUF779 family)